MASKARITCLECKTDFSDLSNLRAHVKRKHPDKLKALCPKKLYTSMFTCSECKKGFVNKSNLKVHLKLKHSGKQNVLADMTNRQKNPLKCTLCPYEDNYCKNNIIEHFKQIHDIQVEIEKHEFYGYDKFLAWKNDVEKETTSSFVKMHGSYKTNNYTRSNYSCHRSGQFRKTGTGERHLKTQGSNKLNGFCPANMDISLLNNGKCIVTFLKTHVGHKADLGHLFLTESERHELASKIASKIPFQSILDEIQDSVSNCKLERLHLLKKKDLYNIEQCFNLNKSSVRHASDVISVESWVNEMRSSVLFYKPQDTMCEEYPNLKKEDFALIIMTQGQMELLKQFGNDTICIDGTHGLNGYGFELHTLLILDDLREGYPTAFLISNRADEEIFNIFFSSVKDKIETKIKSRVFMSDMAEVYYNAWLQVMDPSEFRLFCTWHVDRAWRNNLDKVATKEKKVTVYKMLRTLLHETDRNAFSKMIHNFIVICKNDPDTFEFGIYFDKYYAKKVDTWAYCYRVNSGLNTNMHLERMHRTIKYIYLNGKFVKRLDKGIDAIMRFVRAKLFERLIIIHKGKICTKLRILRNRHKTSEELSLDLVVETEGGWEVLSSSKKEIYIVQELRKNCECQLICSECNACLHQYTCSCLDSSIKWNMCKHIHIVCKYIKHHPPKEIPEKCPKEQLEGANEANSLFIDMDPIGAESSRIVESISQSHKSEGTDTLLKHQQKLIAELSQKIYSTTSFEELDVIRKINASVDPTLEALRHSAVSKNKFLLDEKTAKIPHNKNICPQRHFTSTRKASKKYKKKISLRSISTEAVALSLINADNFNISN